MCDRDKGIRALLTCVCRIHVAALLVVLPLAVPVEGSGQAVYVGVTGGWGLASTTNEREGMGAWRGGHAVGFSSRVVLTDVLALQLEVQDVERGFTTQNGQAGMQQRYLEMPVLLVAALGNYRDTVAPELMVGVAPSRERSCDAWRTHGMPGFVLPGQPAPPPCSTFRNQVRDFAGVAGGGTSVRLGGSLVSLSVRYHRGLMTTTVGGFRAEEFNRAWSFGASAMMPLGVRSQAAAK
jgi:hypothetical protein